MYLLFEYYVVDLVFLYTMVSAVLSFSYSATFQLPEYRSDVTERMLKLTLYTI